MMGFWPVPETRAFIHKQETKRAILNRGGRVS